MDVSKFTSKKKLENLKKETGKEKISDKVADSKNGECIRLANRHKGGALHVDTLSGRVVQDSGRDTFSSPQHFLRGDATPSFSDFVVKDPSDERHEGELIRKATETKLKRYWYCLLGNELYVYKNKNDEKHKGMHSLHGVFIKE